MRSSIGGWVEKREGMALGAANLLTDGQAKRGQCRQQHGVFPVIAKATAADRGVSFPIKGRNDR